MPKPTTSQPINHQRQTYKHPIPTGNHHQNTQKNSPNSPLPPIGIPSRYHAVATQTHYHAVATQNQTNHRTKTSHCTACAACAPGNPNAPPTIEPPRLFTFQHPPSAHYPDSILTTADNATTSCCCIHCQKITVDAGR
jgi:hypothetical protein